MINRQDGQAMMAGMVMILVLLGAASLSYQIGHAIKAKSLLMVATDAAAFSVAQEQSSVLNTLAYLNRAQIAHQVALAHLVTLASAERFRQTQSVQSMAHHPPAALIGMLFGPHHAAAYVASNVGNTGAYVLPEKIMLAYRWHDQTVHELIERSQHALLMEWEKRRDQVFEEALYRNLSDSSDRQVKTSGMRSFQTDPKRFAALLKNMGVEWKVIMDETKQKVMMQDGQHDTWMQMLAAVVKTQSYLDDRRYTVKNKWVIHPRCPWRRHILRRHGQTRLRDNGTWSAQDTLSFHAVRSNKWIGCYMREYPMGWSMIHPASHANHSKPAPRNFSTESYWKWLSKREGSTKALKSYGDNRLATAWSRLDAAHLGGKGQASHSTLKHGVPDSDDRSISIQFQTRKKLFSFPMKRSMGIELSGALTDGVSGLNQLHMRASAVSQAFFSDPSENGMDKRSAPSMFRPYWQGRISGKMQ